jgi:rhodanese-related sulfurtransferase
MNNKQNKGVNTLSKMFKLLLIVIVAVAFFGGCSQVPEKSDSLYKKISAEEAKARMDENKDVIILDVRTSEEYNEGHIENAILIPNETILDSPPDALPDLNAEILIYCRSGNRSQQAAEKLIDLGYTNVYDFGGIIDWPYDTVTE